MNKQNILRYSALFLLLIGASIGAYFLISKYKADVTTPPSIASHSLGTDGLEDISSGWLASCKDDSGKITSDCTQIPTYPNGKALKISSQLSDNEIEKKRTLLLTKNFTTFQSAVTNKPTIKTGLRQKYRISFWTKIDNRTCYNYPSENNSDGTPMLGCGIYDIRFSFDKSPDWSTDKSDTAILTYTKADTNYIRPKNQDWFYTEATFTHVQTDTAEPFNIQIQFQKYLGDISFDGLKVEQIDSFVADNDMRIPIQYSKMNSNASDNKYSSDDDRNVISFEKNALQASRNNVEFAKITNISNDMFANLKRTSDNSNNYTIYENDNVIMSLAADSTAIIRLKKDLNFSVQAGIEPAYSFYRNGLVFVRDANKGANPLNPNATAAQIDQFHKDVPYGDGILFTPILGDIDNTKYSTDHLPVVSKSGKSETEDVNIAADYLRSWNLNTDGSKKDEAIIDFNSSAWNVSYNGLIGDAFIMSIFPPKEFDTQSFCGTKINSANKMYLNDNNLEANFSAFSNFYNYADNYRWSYNKYQGANSNKCDIKFKGLKNDQENTIKKEFDLNGSGIGNCSLELSGTAADGLDSKSYKNIINNFEVNLAGPYQLDSANPLNLFQNGAYTNKNLLNNKYGVKSGVYIGAGYFYNNMPEELISNFSKEINSGVDGVYEDGYERSSLIRALKQARLTRNAIGDKIYIEHYSGNSMFFGSRSAGTIIKDPKGPYMYDKIRDGGKFSVPFLAAYADVIRTGEVMPFQDYNKYSDIWQNNYTGYGLSNSVNELLVEPDQNNLDTGQFDPLMQAAKQLTNNARIRIISYPDNYYQGVANSKLNGDMGSDYPSTVKFNMQQYLNNLSDICKPINGKNNTCDLGENYENDDSNQSCAPKTTNNANLLTKSNDTLILKSANYVANWLVNGKPIFDLHYNFQTSKVAYDMSQNKLDPTTFAGSLSNSLTNLIPINGRFDYSVKEKTAATADRPAEYEIINRNVLGGYHGFLQDSSDRKLKHDADFSVFARINLETDQKDAALAIRTHAIYAQGTETKANYILGYDQDKKIFVKNQAGEICTAITPLDTKKSYVVGFTYTLNDKKISIYINGQSVETKGKCNIGIPTEDNMYFIGYSPAREKPLVGQIGELFVASQAFSADTIRSFYGTDGTSPFYLQKLKPSASQMNADIKAIINVGYKKYETINLK